MKKKEVVSCTKENAILVWKYDSEGISLFAVSHFLVRGAQEAILFLDGQDQGVFEAGCHFVLERCRAQKNWKRALRRPGRRRTAPREEIYFVNRAIHRNIPWGESELTLLAKGPALPAGDLLPEEKLPAQEEQIRQVAVKGVYSLRISHSRKLIEKLVGARSSFAVDDLEMEFASEIRTLARDILSRRWNQRHLHFQELEADLCAAGQELCCEIGKKLEPYGVMLENFIITGIRDVSTSAVEYEGKKTAGTVGNEKKERTDTSENAAEYEKKDAEEAEAYLQADERENAAKAAQQQRLGEEKTKAERRLRLGEEKAEAARQLRFGEERIKEIRDDLAKVLEIRTQSRRLHLAGVGIALSGVFFVLLGLALQASNAVAIGCAFLAFLVYARQSPLLPSNLDGEMQELKEKLQKARETQEMWLRRQDVVRRLDASAGLELRDV